MKDISRLHCFPICSRFTASQSARASLLPNLLALRCFPICSRFTASQSARASLVPNLLAPEAQCSLAQRFNAGKAAERHAGAPLGAVQESRNPQNSSFMRLPWALPSRKGKSKNAHIKILGKSPQQHHRRPVGTIRRKPRLKSRGNRPNNIAAVP